MEHGDAVHFDSRVSERVILVRRTSLQHRNPTLTSCSDNLTTCMCSTSFLRYLFAFGFPLFTRKMYETMGAQWAGTLIGV